MKEVVGDICSNRKPFISIWICPQETIRQIVDTNPGKYVIALMMISGTFYALSIASASSLGDDMSMLNIFLVVLIGGPTSAIILLHFRVRVLQWSGGLLGGIADSQNVRAAIAWSSLPDIVLLIIFLPIITIFGHDLFTSSTEWIDANEVLLFLSVSLLVIAELVITVWKAFILIKCLAEVHGFSVWKSLASIIIGFLSVFVTPVLILIFVGN